MEVLKINDLKLPLSRTSVSTSLPLLPFSTVAPHLRIDHLLKWHTPAGCTKDFLEFLGSTVPLKQPHFARLEDLAYSQEPTMESELFNHQLSFF